MINADVLAARVQQVPLLSPAVRKLIVMLGNPAANLREISQLVEIDPALTIQVLRAANAAFFHRGMEIRSVQQAVSHLGEELVFSVAVRTCAGDVMNHPLQGYMADDTCLWSHSVYTALAARQLAHLNSEGPEPDLAYTAGLLHDIGKAILSDWLCRAPGSVARRVADPGDHEFIQIEESLLGINHQSAGHALARHWMLPEVICDAILHHHKPGLAGPKSAWLAEIVHVADLLALMAGFTTGADALNYRLDLAGLKHFKFSRAELDRLVSLVQEEFLSAGQALLE
ncbi:MAG: HDOD domain-containing protein [Candidatus Delongbacteria bacterium]